MFRKLDTITITLSLIIAVFIGTFFFLAEKNKNDNYILRMQKQLTQLTTLEKDIDIFFTNSMNYTNYDIITKEADELDKILTDLENSLHPSILTPKFLQSFKKLRPSYQSERDLLEYQKSLNAVTLNAMHYLFDLRVTINNSKSIALTQKKRVDELLFLLMQVFSGLDTQTKTVHDLLYTQKTHKDKNVARFYAHAKLFLQNISLLKSAIKEHKEIALQAKIETNKALFSEIKEYKFKQEQLLNKIFALGLILLLLILLYLHRRSLKIQHELAAFKLAIEHSDNSIVMTDLDFNITYVNESFERNTGYTQKEALGHNPSILKSGLTDETLYKDMHSALERGESWNGEFTNRRKDDSIFYERAFILPISIKNKIDSYLAIKLDVTSYKEQAERMQLTATVFDSIEEGIIVTDADQKILSINRAFAEMFGYTVHECIGKTPKIFKSEEHPKEFYTQMWNEIDEKGIWKGKIRDRAKDGTCVTLWMSISVVKNKDDEIVNYISIHTNLADIIKSQEKIDFLAYHDSLTKLPNRVHFEETLIQALKTAKRKQTRLAILFIDLDRFKVINDTLGHHIGDELLKHVALSIRSVLRDVDMLARIGGDEFVVILEDLHNPDNAATVANKILYILSQPIEAMGHTLNTSASIGIAYYPDDATNLITLVKYADSAMYKAKELGKNRFHFFTDSLSSEMNKRLEIEQELRHALVNNELYLNFQPQYNLKTKKVIGVEALVRWNSKVLGFIGPDVFIPIAEESGLILEIGEFVFRESCRFMKASIAAGHDMDHVAVNVSTQQFKEGNIVQTFKYILQEFALDAKYVEIEITERYIMKSTKENLTILDNLRDVGFEISIDDFGTGYSSMSYLKQLPVDTLKVDKSFVDDVPHDADGVAITNAILALSNSLGYHSVAEGIETQDQEDFLAQSNCEIGQGYLFSRPLSQEKFFEFMKKTT